MSIYVPIWPLRKNIVENTLVMYDDESSYAILRIYKGSSINQIIEISDEYI